MQKKNINKESTTIVNFLIKELLINVVDNLIFDDKKINEKINKNIENTLKFKDILESTKESNIFQTILFEEKNGKKKHPLYHIEVHKQFIHGFCGYHAMFNLIESVEMLKNNKKDQKFTILEPALFWKMLFKTTDFLWNFGKKNGADTTKWPWDYYTTHYGDFERTFLKAYINYNDDFHRVFRSNENFDIKFLSLNFQFGNLIYEESEINNINSTFSNFINYNHPKNHLLLCLMLGVCNHWISFIAHKINNSIEFILFDSRNIDLLKWDNLKIDLETDNFEKSRNLMKKVPWKPFHKMLFNQSLKDLQIFINLIINCCLGNTTILKYNNDKRFEILLNSLMSDLNITDEKFNEKQFLFIFTYENKNISELLKNLNHWILCYYSSMKNFFLYYHNINDLDEDYAEKFNNFICFFIIMFNFIENDRNVKIGKKITSNYKNLTQPKKLSHLFG